MEKNYKNIIINKKIYEVINYEKNIISMFSRNVNKFIS